MRCVIDEIHAALAEKLGDIRAAELLANWQLRPPAEAEAPAPEKFKLISIRDIKPVLDFEYVEPELDLPRANIIEDLDEPVRFTE